MVRTFFFAPHNNEIDDDMDDDDVDDVNVDDSSLGGFRVLACAETLARTPLACASIKISKLFPFSISPVIVQSELNRLYKMVSATHKICFTLLSFFLFVCTVSCLNRMLFLLVGKPNLVLATLSPAEHVAREGELTLPN
jgi:hypothetical protein